MRGVGKPGFPTSPPGGRVGAGAAREQGGGETGFPHFPTRWEGGGGRSPSRDNTGARDWCAAHPDAPLHIGNLLICHP